MPAGQVSEEGGPEDMARISDPSTGASKQRKDPLGSAAKLSPVRVKQIERNRAGQLVVHLEGNADPTVDVRLARCFPWSFPDAYISIRTADGQEIAMLRTLDELDPASREVAAAELRDKIFNPKIKQIVQCRHEFGISSITAETDRGRVVFQILSRDDVRLLSPTRALFRDVDGNTYELPDLTRLDPASQKHLHQYF